MGSFDAKSVVNEKNNDDIFRFMCDVTGDGDTDVSYFFSPFHQKKWMH